MAGVPGQRQDPAVVLLRGKRHGGGPLGFGADEDQLLVPQCSGAQPQIPAGVLDVYWDLLLGRRVVAEFVEPRRGPPGAAGRVDDEIGGQDLFLSGAAAGARRTRAPVTRSRAGVVTRPATSHRSRITTLGRARTRLRTWCSRCRPARLIRRLAGFAVLAQQVAPEEDPDLPRMTEHRDTAGGQAGAVPGKARPGSAPRAATARGRAGPGAPPYGPAPTPAAGPVRRSSPAGTHQPGRGPRAARPCWRPAPPRAHRPHSSPASPAGHAGQLGTAAPGSAPAPARDSAHGQFPLARGIPRRPAPARRHAKHTVTASKSLPPPCSYPRSCAVAAGFLPHFRWRNGPKLKHPTAGGADDRLAPPAQLTDS